MSTQLTPYQEGMQAAERGEPEKANPYSQGSTAANRWRGGHTFAKQQQQAKKLHEAQTLAKAWVQ